GRPVADGRGPGRRCGVVGPAPPAGLQHGDRDQRGAVVRDRAHARRPPMRVALAPPAALRAATGSAARAQGPAASSLDAYRPVDIGPGTARGAEAALAGDVID